MIAAILLALQAAAAAAVPPAVQPASPRTLTGRFACDAIVYEVQVTATPQSGAGVLLERLMIGGKPVDSGSLAEARRMVARLADVQSIDVRCRAAGGGELSIYGAQAAPGAPPRRARLRGTMNGGAVSDLTVAVEQR
ncbi:hypothetical protein [Sphingomonas sp. IC4-52]|uniref:hypothetical protein n=1 Tax=Sphingomonas sp. IC4-52 TaxID=2887202 RepID=UPI001D11EB57|nr:hypothetical protein [Sphingomonas sp. IC4-52]MCC2979853.1 hypothetical protein [Sphingomonas sp. IC4-52]